MRTLPLVALSLLPLPVVAQVPPPSEIVQAELRPGWRTADGRHIAALHLRLAPHWTTYWRSPGEAGVPPEFDWSGSRNLGSLRILWPRPEVFDFQGMETIGYRGEVVLPVEIMPLDPNRPVDLSAGIDLGLCNKICVPARVAVAAELPQTGAPDGMISAALAAAPLPAATAGLTGLHCEIEPLTDGLRVTAHMTLPPAKGQETVVMEPAPPVWVSDTRTERQGATLIATATMVPPPGSDYRLDPAGLRLTILSQDQAVEIIGCPVD
ncbi:MAG: hypothetical protein LBE86_04165 [Gemmobacter sp.]|nr:hypothetical protein [Gemmobacter sp.]